MKISLKTKFWEEEDSEIWGKRYDKLAFANAFFYFVFLMVGIFGSLPFIALFAGLMFLMNSLVNLSYNKRKKIGKELQTSDKE